MDVDEASHLSAIHQRKNLDCVRISPWAPCLACVFMSEPERCQGLETLASELGWSHRCYADMGCGVGWLRAKVICVESSAWTDHGSQCARPVPGMFI